MAIGLADAGAEVVRNHQFRHAAQELEDSNVGADPVRQGLAPGGLGVGVIGRTHHRHKDLRLMDLTGGAVIDGHSVPGIVHEQLFTGSMVLPHHQVQLALPGPVMVAEPTVLVAIRIGFPELLPKQEQGDVLAPELIVDSFSIRTAPGLCWQIRWWTEQSLLQLSFTQTLWQRPAKIRFGGTPQILAYGGATDTAGCGNLSVAQPWLPLEARDFFDFTHG